jgi:hypothetical protein
MNGLRGVDFDFLRFEFELALEDGGGGVAEEAVEAGLSAGEGTEGGALAEEPEGGESEVVVVDPEGVVEEAGFEAIEVAAPLAVVDLGLDEVAEGGVRGMGGEGPGEAEGAAMPSWGEGAGGAGEAPGGIGGSGIREVRLRRRRAGRVWEAGRGVEAGVELGEDVKEASEGAVVEGGEGGEGGVVEDVGEDEPLAGGGVEAGAGKGGEADVAGGGLPGVVAVGGPGGFGGEGGEPELKSGGPARDGSAEDGDGAGEGRGGVSGDEEGGGGGFGPRGPEGGRGRVRWMDANWSRGCHSAGRIKAGREGGRTG